MTLFEILAATTVTSNSPIITFNPPTITAVEGDTAIGVGIWFDADADVDTIELDAGIPGTLTTIPVSVSGEASGTFRYELPNTTVIDHNGLVVRVIITDLAGNANQAEAILTVSAAAAPPTVMVDAPEYFIDAGGSISVGGGWIDPNATALPTIASVPAESAVIVTGGPTSGRWSMQVDASPDAVPPPIFPPPIISTDTTFTFTLTDSEGLTAQDSTLVRISNLGQGPSIQWDVASVTITVGQQVNVTATGIWSDAQGNVTDICLESPYGTITPTAFADGQLSGTFVWQSEDNPQESDGQPITVRIFDENLLEDFSTMDFIVLPPETTHQ